MSQHVFDAALQLQPQAEGVYLGATSPAWANMVGPFGGMTAATVVQAIVSHAQCLGEPVSLTVNYVSAIADGAYTLKLRIARTNRSTQHWVFDIQLTDAQGLSQCVLTGTAMTAARRDPWSANDLPMLGAAGLSVAYHAKPAVREQARVAINEGGLDRLLELFA